jgi:FkbM family methyltransferase
MNNSKTNGWLRSRIDLLLDRLGLKLIPTWRIPSLSQATHLSELFRLLKIDCVFDVGANTGQYRDFLRNQVGYQGLIISFEPIPKNAATLRERASHDSLWIIKEYALGAVSGSSSFNIMASTTFSSFLTPDESNTSQFHEQNRIEQTINVKVKRLDDIFPNLCGETKSKRVYLKLDTQGYDLQVIEGGKSILPDIPALQTEASVTPIYSGMPDYVATIRYLEDHGFCASGFFPVTPERVLKLVEFDCIMVNSRYLDEPNDASRQMQAAV